MTRYARLSRASRTVFDRLELLRHHAAAVDEQIALLTRQRKHLAEKIAWYEDQPDPRFTPP